VRPASAAQPTAASAIAVTVADMQGWYVAQDHLGVVDELMIPETWSVDETVRTVLASFLPEEAEAELARSRS
jgi:hypothetical protein